MIAPVLALLLQVATPLASDAVAKPVETAKSKAAEDKMECHEQVMTGSHFSSRTCLRHSEWMRLHEQSLEELGRRGADRQPGMRPN